MSGAWYQNEEQKEVLAKKVAELEKRGKRDGKVYTEIAPLGDFYYAEEYHQKYFEKAGRA